MVVRTGKREFNTQVQKFSRARSITLPRKEKQSNGNRETRGVFKRHVRYLYIIITSYRRRKSVIESRGPYDICAGSSGFREIFTPHRSRVAFNYNILFKNKKNNHIGPSRMRHVGAVNLAVLRQLEDLFERSLSCNRE